MRTTQSTVSKLEHSTTDKITARDLQEFGGAVGVNLVIMFQSHMTAAERVKHHFFEIKRHLDEMRRLAEEDDDLAKSKKRDPGSAMRVIGPTDPPNRRQLEELLMSLSDSR